MKFTNQFIINKLNFVGIILFYIQIYKKRTKSESYELETSKHNEFSMLKWPDDDIHIVREWILFILIYQ